MLSETRRRRHFFRLLIAEDLAKRVVFSTSPCLLDEFVSEDQPLEVAAMDHGSTNPGDDDDPLAADARSPQIADLGNEVYVEDFDSGSVSEFWTEYAPLAHVEFVGPDGGDQALRVLHSEYEDRVVLRRELEPFDEVYATLETSFEAGFENDWWSLKQMRLHNVEGSAANAGTVDLAIWGVGRASGEQPYLNWTYQDTGAGGQVPIDNFPPAGEPIRISMYVKQSTPGRADGRFMLWMNDRLLVDDAAMLSCADATTRPTGLSFIQNYSPGDYLSQLAEGKFLTRTVDDILFLTDPVVEPELVHQLALDFFANET